MEGLAGKVAVVTGAGSGIGRATALRLAREGAAVHAADLDGQSATDVADAIESAGGNANAHTLDVTDAEAVGALADSLFAAGGRVDILHNNAGVGQGGATEDVTLELWRAVVEVNLMGVIHGVHAFGPRMLAQPGGAHIVNTASAAGLTPIPSLVPYATTKHAVVGLSESLNAEWSPRGVRVTALCPGIINTHITRDAALTGDMAARRERIMRFYERFGASAEDVADAVVAALGSSAPIRTVPRSHVIPSWALHRISPRAAQPLARLIQRAVGG
ncbi:MAG: SDR family NAD(P)-dependent oxidoreductase [Thermoleophilaceae bacterium]|nr:SDR family NAD(P)-dependent oxidoreductase [Thermoleophilaceae bacterium]